MIKLVAFDMDGTFLNTQNDYDRKRFDKIFQDLTARDIKIVAISGNQFHQIKTFFEPYLDQMTIVSEIGNKIYENGHLLQEHHFDQSVVKGILDLLGQKNLLSRCMVGGLDHAYFGAAAPEDFKKIVKKHNYSWKELESFAELPEDKFCIVTLDVPDQDIADLVDQINEMSGPRARAVSSGFQFIDIIQPTINKGTALQFLGQRWGISLDEMMTFGDSDNDLEMLDLTPHSYAMANCPENVGQRAKNQAPSNDESGVLVVIEREILGKADEG
ncbi:Cof-type HAD-IIB family hydrolase [Streptococcus sp. 20-1249]|uniref:Cof-type HAD-IIB family hydrolase n=1 Tax=Streptococcus hepaticus TaxID=3349163 RepID=UPI00374A6FFC